MLHDFFKEMSAHQNIPVETTLKTTRFNGGHQPIAALNHDFKVKNNLGRMKILGSSFLHFYFSLGMQSSRYT